MFQKTTQQKIVSIVSNTNESYKESFYTLIEVKKIQSCINNGTHSWYEEWVYENGNMDPSFKLFRVNAETKEEIQQDN